MEGLVKNDSYDVEESEFVEKTDNRIYEHCLQLIT